MASLGTATLATPPSTLVAGAYTPVSGHNLGTATLVNFGSGSEPVEPKRYLNVGGIAVPIQ